MNSVLFILFFISKSSSVLQFSKQQEDISTEVNYEPGIDGMSDPNLETNYYQREPEYEQQEANFRQKERELKTNKEHKNKTQSTKKDPNIFLKNENGKRREIDKFLDVIILSSLGAFFLLIVILVLCGSKRCVIKSMNGRKGIQRSLQYRPSNYGARVTPTPQDNNEDIGSNTPGIFKLA
jgi:hypothetical protein